MGIDIHGEIGFSGEVKEKLLTISPATIDRLLRAEKKKIRLKGRSHTKPGTLLKHKISIWTFSDWDEDRPGFLEIEIACKHQNKLLESLSKWAGRQTVFVLVSYGYMSYPQAARGWGSLMASELRVDTT